MKITDPRHLDHENEHTFEIEDLKKLIKKTSEDLAEADKKRREEFKVLVNVVVCVHDSLILIALPFLLTRRNMNCKKNLKSKKN